MRSDYCEGKVHIIEEGDTLYQLSRKYDVPLALILRANPFTDVYNLQVGDEICIPIQIGRPPEQPSCPNRPNRPNMPGNGVRPEVPNMPENGTRPEVPNMPNNNGRPERPMPPTMPDFPTMPEMPNIPNMNGSGMNSNRPITLPSFPNLFSYIVEEGESLGDVLDNFDVNLEDLLNFNDLDELLLLPGSVVKVPIHKENSRN